ncbi:T9SS type A sorting domain-containing protein [Hymenobacter cellulosivorans]|uniref:T9SS type A sorting domain-containing protein n=1 Tax=Hymenobacter cellulosivorans TaxID=2932249 RepID=A0ABY4F6D7_9BACT|nr:T9SS type A sorting domain-containing protein [Hymenobacter cellulosivorans]UOQ52221.1 T9SS type A sorting domain-containing protein [Hymenobacter cellulosivorans]
MSSTTTFLPMRRTALVLACAGLALGAQAQTAPAWTSAYEVANFTNDNRGFAVDASGNTYEVSNFTDAAVVGGTTLTSTGFTDAYLAKYTPSGTLAWVRHLGSPGLEQVMDVAVDAAGDVYISGTSEGAITLSSTITLQGSTTPTQNSKAFIVRYSSAGVPLWAQQSSLSSSSQVNASGLDLDAAGNVYATGFFAGSATFGTNTITLPSSVSGFGTYLARFSAATGAVQSLAPGFYYPTTGSGSFSNPRVEVSATGEAYLLNMFTLGPVVGSTTLTSRGSNDVLVAKFNAQGAFEWVQQIGGPNDDRVRQGVVDAAGNLYVATYFTGSATFGTTTVTGFGTSGYDACLVKYSPQGAMLWAQPSGGPGADVSGGVELDAAGNPYLIGTYSDVAQIGSATVTSRGSSDIVVAAYSPQGTVRWVQQAGGPGPETGSYLGLDARGDIYVFGRHTDAATFGSTTLPAQSTIRSVVARLGNAVLGTRATQPQSLGFYPNPASNLIQLPGLPVGSHVELLDALGRVARATTVTAAAQVSVRGLLPGLYTLRATDSQGQPYSGRVIVE